MDTPFSWPQLPTFASKQRASTWRDIRTFEIMVDFFWHFSSDETLHLRQTDIPLRTEYSYSDSRRRDGPAMNHHVDCGAKSSDGISWISEMGEWPLSRKRNLIRCLPIHGNNNISASHSKFENPRVMPFAISVMAPTWNRN